MHGRLTVKAPGLARVRLRINYYSAVGVARGESGSHVIFKSDPEVLFLRFVATPPRRRAGTRGNAPAGRVPGKRHLPGRAPEKCGAPGRIPGESDLPGRANTEHRAGSWENAICPGPCVSRHKLEPAVEAAAAQRWLSQTGDLKTTLSKVTAHRSRSPQVKEKKPSCANVALGKFQLRIEI